MINHEGKGDDVRDSLITTTELYQGLLKNTGSLLWSHVAKQSIDEKLDFLEELLNPKMSGLFQKNIESLWDAMLDSYELINLFENWKQDTIDRFGPYSHVMLSLSKDKAPESLMMYYLETVDWLEVFKSGRMLKRHTVRSRMLDYIKIQDLANVVFRGKQNINHSPYHTYINLINYGFNITQKYIESLIEEGNTILLEDKEYQYFIGYYLREGSIPLSLKTLIHDEKVMLGHLSRYDSFSQKMKNALTESLYRGE